MTAEGGHPGGRQVTRAAGADARSHLEALGVELQRRGWRVFLVGRDEHPALRVTNPDAPVLAETIMCRQADDGTWIYAWSWRQPIGPTDRTGFVVNRIQNVLRAIPEGRRQ